MAKDPSHRMALLILAVVALVAIIGMLMATGTSLTGQSTWFSSPYPRYARVPGIETTSDHLIRTYGKWVQKPKPPSNIDAYCAKFWRNYKTYDRCIKDLTEVRTRTWWRPRISRAPWDIPTGAYAAGSGYVREPGAMTGYTRWLRSKWAEKPQPPEEVEEYCEVYWRNYGTYDECVDTLTKLRQKNWGHRETTRAPWA